MSVPLDIGLVAFTEKSMFKFFFISSVDKFSISEFLNVL